MRATGRQGWGTRMRPPYPGQVYFAGVDLAWAGRNPTGVAVLDSDGHLVCAGAVREDAAVLAALGPYLRGACRVAFDAPLVVANATGQPRPHSTGTFASSRRAHIQPTRESPSLPAVRGPHAWPTP
ncbi:hypothetical protein MSS2_02833 [Mycobacterium marinum]|nr:hypothetical protein MSS2_02833 [Mycobacterium marinum]